ncbi:hypothetical protein D3C87_518030 [compost metagenome]
MTKRIEEVLDLPSLESMIDDAMSPEDEKRLNDIVSALDANEIDIDKHLMDPDGTREHAAEMDQIADAAMTAHKDAIDMAFNMEPKNAGSIMEPAARFLELSMKAMQAKLDARMKGIELKMKREKLDHELRKNQEEGVVEGETPVSESGRMADRNALLKSLKEKKSDS